MAKVRVEFVTLGEGRVRQAQIIDQIHSGVAVTDVVGATAVTGPTCPTTDLNLHARITMVEGNAYIAKGTATALNSIVLVGAGDRDVIPITAGENLSFLELA